MTSGASRADLRRQLAAENPVAEQPTTPSLSDATPLAAVATAIVTSLPTPDAAPLTRRSRRSAAPVAPPLVAAEPFELLEPQAEEDASAADAAAAAEAEAAEEEADAFEAAARLFAFTGETPVQSAAPASEPEEAPAAEHVVPRRKRRASLKRVTTASFSFGVMGIVGLMAVAMTTPAEAVAISNGEDITASTSLVAEEPAGDIPADEAEIQAYVTPSEVENATIARDETYSTVTMAELASESGITNFSNFFVNDPNSAIQWPFAVGVPISYGFGMRSGSMHEGVDFTPGAGSPIQAVADGVVRVSTDSGGAYGVHIIIDHVIDGELVSTHYAHMQYGSRQVEVGDTVTVATVIGRTGNTGRSYGAHTHFEVLLNGTTPIDPIPWLREHAGG